MFMVDFVNPAYAGQPWFKAARERFAPLAGRSAIETIVETKKIIEIIAVIGGQWPHSSFMVPGGVTHLPNIAELVACRGLIQRFRNWYEQRVLGCKIEVWNEIDSIAALEAWLEADAAHANGDLGWLLRLGRAAGLDRLGAGHGNFLSYGLADMPAETRLRRGGARHAFEPGFARAAVVSPFNDGAVGESIASSHYEGYEGLRHPLQGMTHPLPPGGNPAKYSYAKAPRYDGLPAETGPLAEAVVAGLPLFADWVGREGPHALMREAARLCRPARLLPLVDVWLDELIRRHDDPFIQNPTAPLDGEGGGLVNAARGALGHWARIQRNHIVGYQIITPTAWNGSPRDDHGVAGPWEAALVGTPVGDAGNPIEAGHVIRSFDPCLVCTVHSFGRGGVTGRLRLTGF
jgi:hydrogenase large subunit